MLEVHSEHQLEEKSQWIMKGFTTFYFGDFNDSVNGKLLLVVLSAFIFLVLILICLLMPKHLFKTNIILSRQKSILCRCMLVLGILDMLYNPKPFLGNMDKLFICLSTSFTYPISIYIGISVFDKFCSTLWTKKLIFIIVTIMSLI